MRKLMPVARRVLGEGHNLTLMMRWVYAQSLFRDDAATLDVEHGAKIRIVTKAGEAISNVEISDSMLPGMVSLPNGQGLSWPGADADTDLGVYLNELTSVDDRDWFAGTPHHKHVRARLEKV